MEIMCASKAGALKMLTFHNGDLLPLSQGSEVILTEMITPLAVMIIRILSKARAALRPLSHMAG